MKRKIKGNFFISVFCIVVIITIGAVGVGFAAWQEGILMSGTVSTGDIEPVFSKCEVVAESSSPSRAAAMIEDGGKKLNIMIDDAYPGYYVRFHYRVTNLGAVPVRYVAEKSNNVHGIEVELTAPGGVIDGRGGYREGELEITATGIEENRNYNFVLHLDFQQWNAVK